MVKPKQDTSLKADMNGTKQGEQQQFLECKLQSKEQLATGAKTNKMLN